MNDDDYGTTIPLGPNGADGELIRALVSGMHSRQKSSLAMYRVHRDARSLDKYRLVTYRCGLRCLLLDVFRTPVGPAAYFPPFRLSPEQNERTSPDARTQRTTDGIRRWVERAELVAALDAPGMYLELNCDHISRHLVTASEINVNIEIQRSEVVVRA